MLFRSARFAALRVTDRVLSADELLRASDIPPDDTALDTRFHYTFEANATGAPLGTVVNEASWRTLYGDYVTGQYAYAIDGQTFWPSGDGVVTPKTVAYDGGSQTIHGYASNVTARAHSSLLLPDGTLRTNTNCAFLAVGPKKSSSDTWGNGPSFSMTDMQLLVSSDFTAETYWRPDIDGWNAVLGNDAGSRYRTSIFGVAGSFKDDVEGKTAVHFAWDFYFDTTSSATTTISKLRKSSSAAPPNRGPLTTTTPSPNP